MITMSYFNLSLQQNQQMQAMLGGEGTCIHRRVSCQRGKVVLFFCQLKTASEDLPGAALAQKLDAHTRPNIIVFTPGLVWEVL